MTTLSLFDPGDQAARDAIRDDLDDNLFVEAGAGSGKTRALVERVVGLVTRRGVPVTAVAAITFTDKAASELRDRIRVAFEALARAGGPEAGAARVALDELDEAAIGTLHSFAQRLLVEHPVEVGLPPRVEALDEVGSQLEFDERFDATYETLMSDPSHERVMALAIAFGVTRAHLRELARIADDNWDLVAERMHTAPSPVPTLDVADLVAALRACVAQGDHCRDDEDKLLALLAKLDGLADTIERTTDEMDLVALLDDPGFSMKCGRVGRQGSWPDIGAVRAQVQACAEHIAASLAVLQEHLLAHLAHAVARHCLAAADERRAAGRLEFHDLLVLARALLRDPRHGPAVRARLADRYRHLLLDEFQDTDPIQIEIAVLLASDDADAGARPWTTVRPEPGRLFVVGDPKQSIYRFRRADVAMYLDARASLGARVVELSSNFRTVAPVIDWVNAVFGELIVAQPGVQPEYRALDPVRPAPPVGPPVVLLGAALHGDEPGADELRGREADDVVAAIETAIAQGWSVGERGLDGEPGWRPARLGDIAVLLPARTSLPYLEERLEAAGIAYRAETSSLVYTTREVRELVLALRAIDDPTDEVAIVHTLRSALYGCGDDDLVEYRVEHGGSWSLHARRPEGLASDHPVVAGLEHLRALHDLRWWLAPSELLDRLVRDRRVLEQGFAGRRPRDVWRRVRFVIDQARAFADAGGGALRDFLAWVELQSADGTRVVESVLPETDDDAVRILTIHGAKGLEFPITILSGLTTKPVRRASGVRLVFPPGETGYGVRFSKDLVSEEYERFAPIDEQMDFEERLRLLYVAATRARDHLVVSLHRAKEGLEASKSTYASLVADTVATTGATATPLVAVTWTGTDPAPAAASTPLDLAAWEAERDAVVGTARVPRSWSATAVARAAAERRAASVGQPGPEPIDPGPVPEPEPEPVDPRLDAGLAKEPPDLELPAWQRGRYGTAVGRAVHAVLQTIDLAAASDLDAAVASQCAAEGIVGAEARVAALVRSALGSETVRAATAASDRWRETYVATTVGDRVVEGYVDLVYRTPDGLVVVDYKTDTVGDASELAAKVAHYRLQGATYALAVARTTGEPVVEMRFVFCTEGRAIDVVVDDLAGAVDEARAIVEGS